MSVLDPLSDMLKADGAIPICKTDFVPMNLDADLTRQEQLPIRDAWKGDHIQGKEQTQ